MATVIDGLKVEVGLGSTPRTALASVSWTDVTSDVLLRYGVTFDRGRSSQDDDPSPGRLSFTLNNATATGKTKGRWTIGGSACTAGWGLRVPVRVRHSTHGVLWVGYVDATSTGWDGGVRPLVRVEASDRLARFARIKMVEGLIRAEQEYDDPVLAWPLDDAAGTSTVYDRRGRPSATLTQSQVGSGGSITFAGGVEYGPDDSARPRFERVDASNGPYLTANIYGDYWSTAMTVEAWVLPVAPGSEYALNGFLTIGDTPGEQLSVYTNASGYVLAVLGNPTYSVTGSTLFTLRHLAVTVSWSAGSTTAELFINGVSQGTTTRTMDPPSGRVDIGHAAYISSPANADIGAVAIYDEVLSSARILEHYRAGLNYPESPYERVQRLARLAGVPTADVAASGSSTYPEPTMGMQPTAGASFLDACHAAAAVEDGVFFLDRTGVLRLHRRSVRLGAAVGLTLAPTDVDSDVSLQTDTDRVVNDVTVSRIGGATYRKVNTTSATDYDTQDATVSLACGTDSEALNRAEWIVYERGTPEPRIDSVSVDLVTRAATVDVGDALTADVSTRIQLTPMPTGDSPSATVDLFVEGVRDEITHEQWLRTFATSSATVRSNVFILDDPSLGMLDAGRVLA